MKLNYEQMGVVKDLRATTKLGKLEFLKKFIIANLDKKKISNSEYVDSVAREYYNKALIEITTKIKNLEDGQNEI